MKEMIFKKENITLRPFRKSDAKMYSEYYGHKDVVAGALTTPLPFTEDIARKSIARGLYQAKKEFPKRVAFAIDVDGTFAGGITIMNIDGHKAELGYWMAKPYWGKGIMTRTIALATEYALKELKLVRITARTLPTNIASIRALEKNGFELEGLLKKDIFARNKFYDLCLYAKVK